MKIITNDAAYLSKYYLNILVSSSLVTGVGVPISMFDVTSKKSFDKYENKDFIKFTKEEEIKFLKESDWIIDYSLYITKSIGEIIEEIANIDLEGNEINEYFNNLNEEQKESEFGYLSIKVKMLGYKRESLEDILSLKKNNKTINLEKDNLFQKLLKKVKK